MIFLQRCDAVVIEARRAAPDNNISVSQFDSDRFFRPGYPAEQEGGRDAERDRHNRLTEIFLVFILMQRHFSPGLVAVDKTGIGLEIRVPSFSRGARSKP